MRKIILALSLLFCLFPLSQAKTYETPEVHVLVYNQSNLSDKEIQSVLKVAASLFANSDIQISFDIPRAGTITEHPICLFFLDRPMPGASMTAYGINISSRAYVFPYRIAKDAQGIGIEAGYVVAHEIGHTLGLKHTNDPRSLMYKYADMERISRLCPIERFSHEEIATVVSTYRRQHALARES